MEKECKAEEMEAAVKIEPLSAFEELLEKFKASDPDKVLSTGVANLGCGYLLLDVEEEGRHFLVTEEELERLMATFEEEGGDVREREA
jgi:hypothetical protein